MVQNQGNYKSSLLLSLPLAAIVGFISYKGLFTTGFYAKETADWQAQSLGQDMVDLYFIVPVLLGSALLSYKSKTASVMWGGTLLYLIYTFTVYCFDVHFNRLFLLYCFALGLSFYLFLYFIYTQVRATQIVGMKNILAAKVTGTYFVLIAFLFYFLWLSEIVSSVSDCSIPKSLVTSGLPTNPVHVLDLSILLPGLVIISILLRRKKLLGYILAPTLLSFFFLMDFTIGALVAVMNYKGLEGNISLTIIMPALGLFSLILLLWYSNNVKART